MHRPSQQAASGIMWPLKNGNVNRLSGDTLLWFYKHYDVTTQEQCLSLSRPLHYGFRCHALKAISAYRLPSVL